MEGVTRTCQWCWILFILLLGIQQLNGQSDSFIYGLCNVNKYINGIDYESDVIHHSPDRRIHHIFIWRSQRPSAMQG